MRAKPMWTSWSGDAARRFRSSNRRRPRGPGACLERARVSACGTCARPPRGMGAGRRAGYRTSGGSPGGRPFSDVRLAHCIALRPASRGRGSPGSRRRPWHRRKRRLCGSGGPSCSPCSVDSTRRGRARFQPQSASRELSGDDSAEYALGEIATARRRSRSGCVLVPSRLRCRWRNARAARSVSTYAPKLGRRSCELGRYDEAEPAGRARARARRRARLRHADVLAARPGARRSPIEASTAKPSDSRVSRCR